MGSRRTDKVHDEWGRVTGGWEDGRGLCSVEEVARGARGATDHGGGMRIGWLAAGSNTRMTGTDSLTTENGWPLSW